MLTRLAEECRDVPHSGGSPRLRDVVLGRFEQAKDDDAFPMQPPRALWEIRQALGREDILISDVGLHKLWIGRMFPAHEPQHGPHRQRPGGMGFALPCAIAAKLVHPERKVVTVSGDGGFLMNCQELETAMRLKTPIVNVVWENRQFGSIVWKQDKKFGEHFGVDFTNPDFVRLAEAFGMPAWRCEAVDDFGRHLRHALTLDVPSLIVAADRLLDRRRDHASWAPRPSRRDHGGDVRRPPSSADPRRGPQAALHRRRVASTAPRATLAVEDPATGETLAEVADATPDDALAALGAAHEAQAEWRDACRRASAARSCAAPTS